MNSITILFFFVPVLVVILLIANVLLAAHRPDTEKVTAYECGFSPIYGQTRAPFSIQYYLIGILFLVFDLEILLLFPMSVTLYQISIYGFWIAMTFFAVLTLGFVFEIGSGALYFTDQRSSINRTSIVKDQSDTTNPLPFTKATPVSSTTSQELGIISGSHNFSNKSSENLVLFKYFIPCLLGPFNLVIFILNLIPLNLKIRLNMPSYLLPFSREKK